MDDLTPTDLAWSRAALANAVFVRALAGGLSAVLPEAYPAPLHPLLELVAQGFGVQPAVIPETAAVAD